MFRLFLFLIWVILNSFIPTFSQNKVSILDDAGTNPGMVIDELSPRKPNVSDTFYLASNWQIGDVYLNKKRVLRKMPLKYDLKNNMLEIKTEKEVKVCPLSMLSRFNWKGADSDDTVLFFK